MNGLQRGEFVRLFRELFSNVDVDHGRLFDVLDVDGNGTLSLSEFVTGMFVFAEGTDEEKLTLLFHAFDANASGAISYKE